MEYLLYLQIIRCEQRDLTMKKIMVIHPEGNLNNNPNLAGIVEILCENGYVVDIYSLKSPS